MQGSEPIDVARMREIAAQAVDPCVTSSMVVAAFWEQARGSSIDPKAGYDVIQDEVDAVRDGGMTGAQATLVGQAMALNAIFAEMARRGGAMLGRPGNAAERYLKLAMRAQAQCRATLQVLNEIAEGGTPDEAKEDKERITRIERVIVYPPLYDDAGNIVPGAQTNAWLAWKKEQEGHGKGLDG
jgi:hypothetical protein